MSVNYHEGIVNVNAHIPVADPDFELRWGPGFGLLALPAFLPSVISSFLTQNKGGGGGQAPWVPPLDPPLYTFVSWSLFRKWHCTQVTSEPTLKLFLTTPVMANINFLGPFMKFYSNRGKT